MEDKSIYFQIPKTEKEGFVVQYDELPHFYNRLHHHPELQLIYILDGSGDLFVGDTITPFGPGCLFLIGSNQSHLFKSEPEYFEDDPDLTARSISIFFHEQTLGERFFDIVETSAIKHLIERSKLGTQFFPSTAHKAGIKIKELLEISGFERFIAILSLLNELAESGEYKHLATISEAHPPSDEESQKVNDVITFILTHYKDDIELQKVADIANYSKAAFCRFFKQRTRKTFSRFLNEVRVAQACKLLHHTDLNISQIGYESGFNNISNFNRQFKRITGMTPMNYLKKYKESNSVPSRIHYEMNLV
ncbi:MAG TPA: AraC family transcriptional regulator [Balneolales bacterium]|nr:AraC family transcriptional regulator [Balneolales bacterium]